MSPKRCLVKSAMLLKVDSADISWNQRKKEFNTRKNIPKLHAMYITMVSGLLLHLAECSAQ